MTADWFWWPVAIVATGAGLAGLWVLFLLGRHLYIYARYGDNGVKDPTVYVDVERELRREALREMQIEHRERQRLTAIVEPRRRS